MNMLTTLAISNYRSIRNLIVPLSQLNVVTGPNGSGKSSLYRGLRLLAQTARGELISSLAREGGLQSTFWAGPEKIAREVRAGRHAVEGVVRKNAYQLRLGFGAEDLSYAIDLGYPSTNASGFDLDPAIKRECIWAGPVFRPAKRLIDRRGPALLAVNDNGDWDKVPGDLSTFESMMHQFSDPRSVPEMITIRERIRAWRFYDHFRTDQGSPCRMPQIGTYTPILSDDGADLAAALQTIHAIGDSRALSDAIDDAFPGSRIMTTNREGWFEVEMSQHGLLRPLKTAELSDGTLRYLLLVAALLTPRPPELLVLNEPETSLHPDLIPALGRLIARAAKQSQVIVVSHNERLIEWLCADEGTMSHRLEKHFGETRFLGDDPDRPNLDPSARWKWPEQ
jgi:predicted ATPase